MTLNGKPALSRRKRGGQRAARSKVRASRTLAKGMAIKSPPTGGGWIPNPWIVARIVCAIIILLYLAASIWLLPTKYHELGIVGAVLGAAMIVFCLLEGGHIVCRAIESILLAIGSVICNVGLAWCQVGVTAGEALMSLGRRVKRKSKSDGARISRCGFLVFKVAALIKKVGDKLRDLIHRLAGE
ncbi:MAG: hypothetical protein ABL996_18575 [Micropepsaceae bacterium]